MKNANAIAVSAATDENIYSPGQTVRVFVTARNTSARAATLHFSSGRRVVFSIFRDGSNDAVYTFGAGGMFTQVLGQTALAPGAEHRFEAALRGSENVLKPGNYRLEARLADTGKSAPAAPIRFTVRDLQLDMTLQTDQTRYAVGQPINFEMQVKNLLDKSNAIRFSSGMTYDVFVTRDNLPVWNDSANKRYAQAMRTVVWNAGESKTFRALWNGQPLPGNATQNTLPPGRYRIQAVLNSTPKIYAPTVDIFIVDKL